ncbi:Transposase (plasmid) [Streptomyces sp. YIM 121038]|uniref:transposase n=1 Tax=Streptomyces sp. YIM 121038 TaxID=2136401 RepID=UPI001161FE85|nr:transposase [Streptomyces sp. YIM 121038]QCX82672.1 Transposase [Streptomyces sp. YIM 121038]
MAEMCKRFEAEFWAGAVRIVREAGKPIARVAGGLGVSEGTLATWISRKEETSRAGLAPSERAELQRLRGENHELRMERDVLKRSVLLWVKEATK